MGGAAVGQMLSKNTAMRVINVSSNRIGNTGIQALSKGLEQSDTIHEVIVRIPRLYHS
jgi:Ran GTPase-activating protein (RanGAP) involved in mRNA processing and transport